MWLIRKDVIEAVEHARAKGLAAPAGAVESFNRQLAECAAKGEPRIIRRAGDVAEIRVEGVLTPKPDFYAYYYGGGNTTYPEIIQSLALAAADPTIRRVVLNVASPGGYVAGLFDTLAALEAFTKPKETLASQADSAAYAIAALGGKITATNPAAEFGSVGVCATYVKYDFEEVIDITSTNAPDKRPDPSTEQGQAVIRKYLDAIEDLFVDAIAKGRGTTVEDVTTNYGRGAVMLANAAKKLGLVDKVAKSPGRSPALSTEDASAAPAAPSASPGSDTPVAEAPSQTTASQPAPAAATPAQPVAPAAPQSNAPAVSGGAPNRTTKKMDEAQLQAEHPGLYAAVFNKGKVEGKTEADKAADVAKAEEKDRIEAHLEAGEQSGDMKTALESIRSGAKMTQKLMTTYMMAGMRKGALDARSDDDKSAAAATEGAAGGKPAKTLQDQIADEIEAQTKGGAAA
jgi:ClpP class serine protease